jgi:hypothetical protein
MTMITATMSIMEMTTEIMIKSLTSVKKIINDLSH